MRQGLYTYLITLMILPRRPKLASSFIPHDVQTTFALGKSSAVSYDVIVGNCKNSLNYLDD